jgi:hypothetical protein
VATSKEIQQWRALRGRFLNALWDEENAGRKPVPVSDLLYASGACDLPDHQIDRLVRDLREDRFISELGWGSVRSSEIYLTTEGRYEIEQWLAEPDKPTDAIPVPANQVFSIGTMNVTGTVMQGSTATNVNTTVGTSGAELVEIVDRFRQLLTAAELSPEDREELDADLDVLEEEAGSPLPKPQRVRPILRRLKGALLTGAVKGAEIGAKQEVIHLIEQAQQLPGISG